jgi:hypothetical protein
MIDPLILHKDRLAASKVVTVVRSFPIREYHALILGRQTPAAGGTPVDIADGLAGLVAGRV